MYKRVYKSKGLFLLYIHESAIVYYAAALSL